jgi:hypothetical protein
MKVPLRHIVWTGVLLALLASFVRPSGLAQEADETPAPFNEDRVSRSFLFHPADTGILTAFEPTIEAGTSTELTVLIGNNGDAAQALRTYAVNLFTGIGGGMTADVYGAEPNPVTAWVDYPEDNVTLQPGEGVERTFTVHIPEDTPPGEYIAGLAGEHADAIDVENSENFNQRLRYVVPIFITVPGEMETDFYFGDVSLRVLPDLFVIDIPVINSGDMHVQPEGTVTLRNDAGQLIATIPVSMMPVFAREETVLSVGISGGLPTGAYQVEIDFTDPDSGASARVDNARIVAEVEATPEPTPLTIASGSVTPAPDADNVHFANVEAVIRNSGEPVTNAQLSLIARVDGEEVERFTISQSLALASGDTPISTRYIPAAGWTSGDWTFELLLETIDSSGGAIVVSRLSLEETITIP